MQSALNRPKDRSSATQNSSPFGMQLDGAPLQSEDLVQASYIHVMFVIAAVGGLKLVEQLYVQILVGRRPLSQPFRTPFFGIGAVSHVTAKERNASICLHYTAMQG